MNIEKFILDKDINVICFQAKIFPEGIMEAFQKLHSLVPSSSGRRNFGISRPGESGEIIYKAALEETFEGEAKSLNCESFKIKSGEYESIMIKDFMQNITNIGSAFQKLTTRPDIDPEGYCLEMYLNENDVRCLVPLKLNSN